MKATFNPLIERIGTALFAVDQYADIFERVAASSWPAGLLRPLFRRRLASDIATAPLLFIHVPKNGGTSVKRALYRSDPGHATARYYDLFFPRHLAAAESIAILRDPADRFLSGFDFLLNGGGRDVRIQDRPMRRMAAIRTPDDFLDFLERAGGDWLKVDTFARPQSWYVADRSGRVAVRHLWLLDRAGDGLSRFLAERGLPPMPHSNATQRRARTLSVEQHDRLRRLYATDYALYAALKNAGGYSSALFGRPLTDAVSAATSASTAS